VLKSLYLKNVGPAPEMKLELAPRVNLITGNNGLGKTFLLDVVWWALTRKWPQELNAGLASGYAARPTDVAKKAIIRFEVNSQAGQAEYESVYVADEQAWRGRAGRPWNPGLVIYALADGGFAVWDPARNYWKKKGSVDVQERVAAYVFSSKDVWDGLRITINGAPTQVSNGLVADWASWIREKNSDAARMSSVLALLTPTMGGNGQLETGHFARLSVNDARDIPTVRTGYNQDVPILYASMGVRRIAALAYMLTWAWREHKIASRELCKEPVSRVVMLFDEIEAHLHPSWQRTMISTLLKVAQTLTLDASASIQLIASTHSPLVLASLEPVFDPQRDAWFDLDLENGTVALRKRPFVRRGEVGNWLTSEAFDLGEPRSLEAEVAIRQALSLAKHPAPRHQDIQQVDQLLRASLGDIDRFWVRWEAFRDAHAPRRGKVK